ncbi:PREDICTED: RCC1 and BTB domain-containing protein 1-like [Cyphomyrmex costatus]|uniref:RCC1 and BTB domain-containing protein 1 n=1 Tax=Cyphomyrmex costatus TaxID=456900 RepID=A0A151IHI9_9HYME|nr:PREDICTED: RCC1 and BTB domain-containing protein 1-like [Cyphomyrmex costatus]KYN01660.1 RCC1 and BTB domain-containing protein 1 [Cyphomyrmex costatus]
MCSELRSWPIFNSLEPKFVSQIHMVFVYGKLGNEALIVTKDKMVYGLGNDINGCLGIGNENVTLELKKVEALCGKDIKTFACGSGHVLALTKEGEVYSWGYYHRGRLRDGIIDDNDTFMLNTPTLVKHDIIDIACGSNHSVVLTKDYKIYMWGNNKYLQLGYFHSQHCFCKNEENCGRKSSLILEPTFKDTPILAFFKEMKVVYVSCGGTFTIVITENGDVYSCGYNCVGQLGRPSNNDLDNMLRQVDFFNDAVKIVCGFEHTLALTNGREIYAWGGNNNGQLGIGNKQCSSKPILVKYKLQRIKWIDIAALPCYNISVALSEEGRAYVWGDCCGQSILTPTATSFSNVHDAIAYYGPSVMHKPLVLYMNKEPSVLESLKAAFDESSTSDLKIQVEGQFIHVHKAILKIRSEYFKTMFQHDWIENNQNVIKHDQFSYVVYKAYLKYLYIDAIDLPLEMVSELLDLAETYCEKNLKQTCIQMIKQGITASNVEYFYGIAVKYTLEELQEFCIKFALNNHKLALLYADDFAKQVQNIIKPFITKACEVSNLVILSLKDNAHLK